MFKEHLSVQEAYIFLFLFRAESTHQNVDDTDIQYVLYDCIKKTCETDILYSVYCLLCIYYLIKFTLAPNIGIKNMRFLLFSFRF